MGDFEIEPNATYHCDLCLTRFFNRASLQRHKARLGGCLTYYQIKDLQHDNSIHIKALNDNVIKLTSELNYLKHNDDDNNAKVVENYLRQIDELKHTIKELHTATNKKDTEIKSLKDSLVIETTNNKELNEELNTVREEEDRLTEELNTYKKQLSKLKDNNDILTAKCDKQSNAITQLKTELTTLQNAQVQTRDNACQTENSDDDFYEELSEEQKNLMDMYGINYT